MEDPIFHVLCYCKNLSHPYSRLLSAPYQVKVVIADAHDLFRSLLKFWIESEPSIGLAAETGSGLEVHQLIKEHKADLLLMDPLIPERSGFDIARELSEDMPGLRMIAIYPEGKPYLVDQIQRSGFHGSVCKNSNTISTLKEAIENVQGGNAYFCAQTCRIQNILYNSNHSFAKLLSLREQQILAYIGAGMDNEDIGTQLKLSPATVQTHRRNLFRKLGIHDTPSLMRYAIEQGFWTPGFDPSIHSTQ